MPNFKDITGQRFGRLVVVQDVGRTIKGEVRWRCQCDCGEFAIVRSSNLHSGNSQSCGCLAHEHQQRAHEEAVARRQARALAKISKPPKRLNHLNQAGDGSSFVPSTGTPGRAQNPGRTPHG